MTLLDSFCTVEAFVVEGTLIRATLRFPEADPVYGGHFPGRPVVPGACILQVAKELTERALGMPLRLLEVGNIKFPAALLPSDTDIVTLEIKHEGQDGRWRAAASVRSGEKLNVSMRELVFDKA